MKRILAATDFSARAHRSVRRAAMLAQQAGAEVTLLHIVDEEPEHLVSLERSESRKILEEQIASIDELRGVQCHPVVEIGAAHDAILRTASAKNADLIVMGSHRKQLLRDVFVGTTIERVIRTGTWPVLMVNTEAALSYANLLVALDLSEASAEALRSAHALGFLDGVRLTVAHAFDPLAKSMMTLADVSKDGIRAYVEEERQRATSELNTFIRSFSFDLGSWSPYVAEGGAVPIISQAVELVRPDLLVVGTHGRSGAAKILLGSVAEQLLRALEIDILAVPRGTTLS
jgi:nucleotide-binding universal stress UspA family protein